MKVWFEFPFDRNRDPMALDVEAVPRNGDMLLFEGLRYNVERILWSLDSNYVARVNLHAMNDGPMHWDEEFKNNYE